MATAGFRLIQRGITGCAADGFIRMNLNRMPVTGYPAAPAIRILDGAHRDYQSHCPQAYSGVREEVITKA
jgi:hypothetical protein